jgi:hypothetical protein
LSFVFFDRHVLTSGIKS